MNRIRCYLAERAFFILRGCCVIVVSQFYSRICIMMGICSQCLDRSVCIKSMLLLGIVDTGEGNYL